jgi:hypothetical protein
MKVGVQKGQGRSEKMCTRAIIARCVKYSGVLEKEKCKSWVRWMKRRAERWTVTRGKKE